MLGAYSLSEESRVVYAPSYFFADGIAKVAHVVDWPVLFAELPVTP